MKKLRLISAAGALFVFIMSAAAISAGAPPKRSCNSDWVRLQIPESLALVTGIPQSSQVAVDASGIWLAESDLEFEKGSRVLYSTILNWRNIASPVKLIKAVDRSSYESRISAASTSSQGVRFGGDYSSKKENPGYLARPLILEWDRQKLRVVSLNPLVFKDTKATAALIFGLDGDWAAGELDLKDEKGKLVAWPLILHRDANGWRMVDMPAEVPSARLTALRVLSPDNVLFVGQTLISNFLLHWNGSGLSEITFPDDSNGVAIEVAGSSSSGFWVTTDAEEVYRWDGTSGSWTKLPDLPYSARDIVATGAGEVLVAADRNLFEWQNGLWQPVFSPKQMKKLFGGQGRALFVTVATDGKTSVAAGFSPGHRFVIACKR